jgi:hypothetical protein
LERGYGAVFGNLAGDGGEVELEEEDMGVVRRWGRVQRDLWLEPKQAAVARLVDRWWGRWLVLVVLPAVLVSCEALRRILTWAQLETRAFRETFADDIRIMAGRCMVRVTIPSV